MIAANNDKRVAVFAASMRGGGAERSMANLAKGITKRGYQVDLVLARAEGPYLQDLPESIRVVDLNASRVIKSAPALIRYLRRERPDAMISSVDYVNIVALWARRLSGVKTRLVINEQNNLSMHTANAASRREKLMPWLARRYYKWANAIVAVSAGVQEDLADVIRLPLDRIDVIYNPSVSESDVQASANQVVEHPWFQDQQIPVLLAVGRLTAQKDYPTLLRAFARLRSEKLVRLVILGEGEDREMLEALVRDLNMTEDVSLPGFAENPFAYMARASLFVMSSRWEGLPTVLVEALCCGTPVVSTDCPSGPREILRDPRCGRLVPVADVNALSAAIKSALDGELQKPDRASWLPFEMENVTDRYLKVALDL
jgi:glycosyltransferase involved in cell wall biosynthesis